MYNAIYINCNLETFIPLEQKKNLHVFPYLFNNFTIIDCNFINQKQCPTYIITTSQYFDFFSFFDKIYKKKLILTEDNGRSCI